MARTKVSKLGTFEKRRHARQHRFGTMECAWGLSSYDSQRPQEQMGDMAHRVDEIYGAELQTIRNVT